MAGDLLDEINRVRAELGLQPLTGAGLPRLDVSFLRRKAEEQLRDRLGRWRRERGSLNGGTGGRAVIHEASRVARRPDGTAKTWGELTLAERWEHEGRNRRGSVPHGTTVRLEADRAHRAMVDAGFTGEEAEYWSSRGVVFQRPAGPGENPVFVFAATPDAMNESRMEPFRRPVRLAELLIQMNEASLRSATSRRRLGELLGDADMAAEAEREIAEAEAGIASRRAQIADGQEREREYRAAIEGIKGTGGTETIGRYHQGLADDSAAVLAESLAATAVAHRTDEHGNLLPYLIAFDESEFDLGDSYTLGHSIRGTTTMTLAEDKYFTMNSNDGFHVPVAEPYKGRGTVRHELGHLVDRPRGEPESSDNQKAVWEEAIARGLMSGYGQSSPGEGYAEAYSLWLKRPGDPLAALYAEHFNWSRPPISHHPGRRIDPNHRLQ